LLALDEPLTRLGKIDARAAELAKLRYFTGRGRLRHCKKTAKPQAAIRHLATPL
jgi:hypothetical protein